MTRKIITRAIWLLSLVSLFADLASEMLYPIMPVYLQSVGFSVALIGVLEGVAEVTAGLSKGYFGRLSDQWGRRLPFVRLGYALSALSKPMMALFALPGWVFAARTLDRLGKGLRTGARDALLADQSNRQTRGQVFGFHRSMDTLGGVLGPVAALVYLYLFPGQYIPLFLLAFGPGLLSVGLTFLLNDQPQPASHSQSAMSGRPVSVFAFLHYWKVSPPEYRRVVGGLLAFALFNSSDVFLLLKIKEAGLDDTAVVGLYVFYNLIYALTAYPVGRLADRIGLKPTLLVGLGLFALVYEGMVVADHLPFFVGLLTLYGLYAAATEGIAKAWISTISGPRDTATAIGTFAGLSSMCAFVANSLAGALWYAFGAAVTFAVTGAATLAVIVYLVAVEGQRRVAPTLADSQIPTRNDLTGSATEPPDSLPDSGSTVTLSRSAFAAILVLIACLGAWTVYMSYMTVRTTRSLATNASDAVLTKPSRNASRHLGPTPPAGSTAGASVAAQPQTADAGPVMVDLLAAKRRAAGLSTDDIETLPLKTTREQPISQRTTRTVRLRAGRAKLYTLKALYTHVYTKPDKRSPRHGVVNLGKKIVTPLAEKNGFFYVVYTKRKGRAVSGWFPKKAFRPVS